jgi:DNA-binding beta-propeller fold protein YncE
MRTTLALLTLAACLLRALGQSTAPSVATLSSCQESLLAPGRLASDALGNTYATEPQKGEVVVFDSFGRRARVHAGLAQPLGIAVDSQQRVYLGEGQNGRVSIFDQGWKLLYRLGQGDGEFLMPNHLAVPPGVGNGEVYVSDSRANAVKVYRGATLVTQFGSLGKGPGQFDFPAGICLSAEGEVFVVDQNNDRLQVFDRTGAYRREFRLGSTRPAGRAQAVASDTQRRLYVADAYQGTVKVLDADTGALLASVGVFGSTPGRLNSPGGLARDPYNRLWVASANGGRIDRFGLDSYLHFTSNVGSGPLAEGAELTLTLTAGGSMSAAVQWSKDGFAILGATNATFHLPSVKPGDAGTYSVTVTEASGVRSSSGAEVSVLRPPAIVAQPQSLTAWRGSPVQLQVVAQGTALAYQWLRDGASVAGATEATLAFPEVQPHQAGAYSVNVYNPVGSLASSPAQLTVIAPPNIMEISSATMQTNRMFSLTLNADPGLFYTLEATVDSDHWTVLTNYFNPTGLFEFLDQESASYSPRFYRLFWTP